MINHCKFSVATPQEIHKIRDAIKNASSLAEVERLTRMLQAGQIPGQKPATTIPSAPPPAGGERGEPPLYLNFRIAPSRSDNHLVVFNKDIPLCLPPWQGPWFWIQKLRVRNLT